MRRSSSGCTARPAPGRTVRRSAIRYRGRDGEPYRSWARGDQQTPAHPLDSTRRPRKATSRSMAGASGETTWTGPKRPGRVESTIWTRAKASACSAASSGSSAGCPVARARSQPCASRSYRRICSRSAPVAAPSGPRIAAVESSGLAEGGQQHRGRLPVGPHEVFVRRAGAAAGRWPVGEQRGEDAVHPDQVADQLAHGPVRARGRRCPLLGSNGADQFADRGQRAVELVERTADTYGHGPPLTVTPPAAALGQPAPGGAQTVNDTGVAPPLARPDLPSLPRRDPELRLAAQLTAAPNHLGSWPSRSCWSSPTHATWPSGRSSTAGTSSSSLTSTTWSTRSAQPATESRPVWSSSSPRPPCISS